MDSLVYIILEVLSSEEEEKPATNIGKSWDSKEWNEFFETANNKEES